MRVEGPPHLAQEQYTSVIVLVVHLYTQRNMVYQSCQVKFARQSVQQMSSLFCSRQPYAEAKPPSMWQCSYCLLSEVC